MYIEVTATLLHGHPLRFTRHIVSRHIDLHGTMGEEHTLTRAAESQCALYLTIIRIRNQSLLSEL